MVNYWHRFCWGDQDILKVIIINLQYIYICKAQQEGCVGLYDVKLNIANRCINYNGADGRGKANAELDINSAGL